MVTVKRSHSLRLLSQHIMPRPKRTIEELANKSDSEDENYSDHPVRSSRHSARSKSRKKPSKPTKKRARRHSDDDITSDDDDILDDADDLDLDEDDEEDPNAPKNARGLTARRAAISRPVYNEGDSSSVEDDFAEADDSETNRSPKKRKSTVVTLKVNALKRQPLPEGNRRATRRTRDPSEDIVALTNSGRHMELVERGTQSPEMEARRSRRGSRASKRLHFGPEKVENEEKQEFEAIEETSMEVKASQPEIMESDHQGDFEEGVPSGQDSGEGAAEGDDVGIVPESDNDEVKHQEEDDEDDEGPTTRRRRGRTSRSQPTDEAQPDEQEEPQRRRSGRKKRASSQRKRQDDESDFEPEEDESNDDEDEELSQSGKSHGSPRKASQARDDEEQDSTAGRRPGLRKRASRSRGQSEVRGDIAEELAEELDELRGDRPRRRIQADIVYEKPRRSRKDVDYRIIRPDLILPIEEAENEVNESPSRRGRGGGGGKWERTLFPTYGPFGGGGPPAILAPPGAPAATGGVESDSSDDEVMQHPKGAAAGGSVSGPPGAGLLPTAQTHGADPLQGPSGTPANLGKIKDKQALADADPLGVDVNVNFDSVGGLQGHIDQLKEMVSLPLLYPEIFQRFHIVPPRGVLFHGPPGTGKTLLARALANSVSSEGRKVRFYMRKGADALSKWVGEAERQLRLLFEEARKTQPSIIFFDEIDGKCSRRLQGFYVANAHPLCRSGSREIKQARTDPCLHRVDSVGFNGWYGWPWPSDCHRSYKPTRLY